MSKIEIGSPGLAGGMVFYDRGDSAGGWRYLEAAPADMETPLRWIAQSYGDNWRSFPNVDGTGIEIGTGRHNSSLILAVDADAPAAKACVDYICAGFSDWFLPSLGELDLMYTNLHRNSLGSFAGNWYWSSSQYAGNINTAWYQYFNDGYQDHYYKYSAIAVRAIRAF